MPTATRSACLDQYGRYAKTAADIHVVKLFADDCTLVRTLTADQFNALPKDERQAINAMNSAAPCIETEGKSNA